MLLELELVEEEVELLVELLVLELVELLELLLT